MNGYSLFNVFVAIHLLLLSSCASASSQEIPANSIHILRLRRVHRSDNPIVFGRVEQKEQDGITHPVQIASIVADGKISRTQADGSYALTFSQGRHTITVKWLGLKSLTVRQISLHRGDSVNINFRLVSDTTKYVN